MQWLDVLQFRLVGIQALYPYKIKKRTTQQDKPGPGVKLPQPLKGLLASDKAWRQGGSWEGSHRAPGCPWPGLLTEVPFFFLLLYRFKKHQRTKTKNNPTRLPGGAAPPPAPPPLPTCYCKTTIEGSRNVSSLLNYKL